MKPIVLKLFLSILVAASAISCGDSKKSQLDEIESLEMQVSNLGPAKERRDLQKVLIGKYRSYVQSHPADEHNPEMIYKTAMLQADPFAEYHECVKLLEQLRREYPEHPRAENALFLIAYTYSENLKDYEKARHLYTSFLDRYPNSELVTSVQFELDNMGKPIEEIEVFKGLIEEK